MTCSWHDKLGLYAVSPLLFIFRCSLACIYFSLVPRTPFIPWHRNLRFGRSGCRASRDKSLLFAAYLRPLCRVSHEGWLVHRSSMMVCSVRPVGTFDAVHSWVEVVFVRRVHYCCVHIRHSFLIIVRVKTPRSMSRKRTAEAAKRRSQVA